MSVILRCTATIPGLVLAYFLLAASQAVGPRPALAQNLPSPAASRPASAAPENQAAPPATSSPAAPPAEAQRVLATVGDRSLTVAEVEFAAAAALAQAPLAEAVRKQLRDQWIQVLVERELVLSHLERTGLAASAADVELEVQQLASQLKASDVTLPQHLARWGLSEAQFRRSVLWRLSWRSYLERYAGPTNLEKYFLKKQRHFDGGQTRAAHILWKLPSDAASEQRQAALAVARTVREQIARGEFSFAAAAKQHSQAPTADQGGEVGWIERHGFLAEPVANAAFDLAAGQISEPVESPAGVHLVQCLEIKPGPRTWREAADELRPAVAAYLFRWIADRERPQARIAFPPERP